MMEPSGVSWGKKASVSWPMSRLPSLTGSTLPSGVPA